MSSNSGNTGDNEDNGSDGQDLESELTSEVRHLAQLAVNFDTNNDLEAAVYYYQVLNLPKPPKLSKT